MAEKVSLASKYLGALCWLKEPAHCFPRTLLTKRSPAVAHARDFLKIFAVARHIIDIPSFNGLHCCLVGISPCNDGDMGAWKDDDVSYIPWDATTRWNSMAWWHVVLVAGHRAEWYVDLRKPQQYLNEVWINILSPGVAKLKLMNHPWFLEVTSVHTLLGVYLFVLGSSQVLRGILPCRPD